MVGGYKGDGATTRYTSSQIEHQKKRLLVAIGGTVRRFATPLPKENIKVRRLLVAIGGDGATIRYTSSQIEHQKKRLLVAIGRVYTSSHSEQSR
jgi:hypothetical protein